MRRLRECVYDRERRYVELDGNGGTLTAWGDGETIVVAGDNAVVCAGRHAGHRLAATIYVYDNASVSITANSGDTFVYASWAGNLEIQELGDAPMGGWSADNILQLSDLNIADVTLSGSGATLDITVTSTGSVVSIDDAFAPAAYGDPVIRQIQFADGAVAIVAGNTVTETFADGSTAVLDFDVGGPVTRSVDEPDGGHRITTYYVTGQPYAAYENLYDASWALTSQTLFNADGSIYQSETVTRKATARRRRGAMTMQARLPASGSTDRRP